MIIVMKFLNEQHSVERCISDFHDEKFVDKIRIVDCGSSDFSVQLLKQFPKVEVFKHFYIPDYHDQEISSANIMWSYVPNGEIGFSLDFDERCNAPLKKFLSEINDSNELPEGADMVHVARRTFEVLRHENSPFAILGDDGWSIESHTTGGWPDFQPRILRKNYHMHWIQSPHRTLCGFTKNHNLDTSCFINHYAKDDDRDRNFIERRWLKPIASRKALGLPADLHECQPNPEYAEASDIAYWKDIK